MLCGEHKPFALVINKSHNPSSSRPIIESTCVSIRHVDYLLSFLLLSMYTVLIFLSCNGNIALTCKSMLLSDFQSQKTIEKQSAATSQRLPDLWRVSLTRTLVNVKRSSFMQMDAITFRVAQLRAVMTSGWSAVSSGGLVGRPMSELFLILPSW